MKQLFAIKVKNFIMQLIFTPISFFINALAIAPIVFLLGGEDMLGSAAAPNMLFVIPISLALAFLGNELFIRLKGRRTGEYINVAYLNASVDVTEHTDYYEVTITPYVENKRERKLTLWGFLARILCFVAFPLRLVALLMSYIALFCPQVFVSHKKLNPDMGFGVGNKILHTLFDFVIIPIHGERTGRRSAKGIIWIFIYLFCGIVINALVALLVASNLMLPTAFEVPLFFIMAFCFVTSLIVAIKHSILISFNYSRKNAVKVLLKILAFPLAVGVLALILAFLPYEAWGFVS